ncbi:hypothetical protein [Stenotrophomonas rhizophila]
MADPIYCGLKLICEPLTWWASAAAWAQAILTVITFAGALLYQAAQNLLRERLERRKADELERASLRRELALSSFVAGREFRVWRRIIRGHLATEYSSVEDEARGAVEAARKITWTGDVHELKTLGDLGVELAAIIAVVQEMADRIEGPDEASEPSEIPLAQSVAGARATMESLVKKLTRGLAVMGEVAG